MKRSASLIVLTVMLALTSLSAMNAVSAQENSILIKVDPGEYYAWKTGEIFTINITIENVDASQLLAEVDVRLGYNDTLLEVVEVKEGPFFKQFARDGATTWFAHYLEDRIGTTPEHVLVGTGLLPDATGNWPEQMPEGKGTIAQITFQSIYQHMPVVTYNLTQLSLTCNLTEPLLTCNLTEPLLTCNLTQPALNCPLTLFNRHPNNLVAINIFKEAIPVQFEDGYYEIVPGLFRGLYTLQSQLEGLNDLVSKLDSKISGNLTEIRSAIDGLQSQLEDLNALVSNLDSKVDNLGAGISGNLTEIRSTIDGLQSQLEDLSDLVSDLVGSLETEIDNLDSKVEDVRGIQSTTVNILYATLAISIIAAIAAAVAAYFARKART